MAGTTTKKLHVLQRRLDDLRVSYGLAGGRVRLLPIVDELNHVSSQKLSGAMSLTDWGVEIQADLNWKPEGDPRIKKFLEQCKLQDGITVVVEDVGRHEFRHWSCPGSLEKHALILDAVADELQKAGKQSKSQMAYLANAFEDLIDNSNVRADGGGEGLVIFYDMQKASPFYTAFVCLNMIAWGNQIERELLAWQLEQYPDEERTKIMRAVSTTAYQMGLFENRKEKSFKDKLAALNDESKWETYARYFVRNFADMMQVSEAGPKQQNSQGQNGDNQQPQSGQNGQTQQQQGQSGANDEQQQSQSGQEGNDQQNGDSQNGGKGKSLTERIRDRLRRGRGKGDEKQEEGKKQDNRKPSSPQQGKPSDGSNKDDEVEEAPTGPGGNVFQDELDSEDGQKKVMEQFMGKGRGLPKFMEPSLALDWYYQLHAPPIEIKGESDKPGLQLPAVPYRREEFDERAHDMADIHGVMITERGGVGLSVKRHKFPVKTPLKESLKSFPDVCVIADCSTSMKSNGDSATLIPWGQQSNYHYLLLGLYGIRNKLSSDDILPYIRMNLILFSNSDSNRSTGWCDYSRSYEIGKLAQAPIFGGTELNLDVLKEQLEGKEPSIVILMSDGAINNWEDNAVIGGVATGRKVGEEAIDMLSKHMVCFMALGGESNVSKAMKKAGFLVKLVRSKRDLDGMMIDVTEQSYKTALNLQPENVRIVP